MEITAGEALAVAHAANASTVEKQKIFNRYHDERQWEYTVDVEYWHENTDRSSPVGFIRMMEDGDRDGRYGAGDSAEVQVTFPPNFDLDTYLSGLDEPRVDDYFDPAHRDEAEAV